MTSSLEHMVSRLSSISLVELTAVEFDSRVDTKFVFHQNKLIEFLEKISADLVILEVEGQRIFNYENLYCDDAKFHFFQRHHSGFGNRSKVRVRKYGCEGPFYFEVKNKTNKGKTVKYRIPLLQFKDFENPETAYLTQEYTGFSFADLPNRTEIEYSRITLSNKGLTEKLTLDFGMKTQNQESKFEFKNLVIAEVKQIHYSSRSSFIRTLKEMKIYETSFSKYCASVALLNTKLKQNRFKKIITNVKNIANA
jgi:hypothetical protein